MNRFFYIAFCLCGLAFKATPDVAPPLKENAAAFAHWCEARTESLCPSALSSFGRSLTSYNAASATAPHLCITPSQDSQLAPHILRRMETEPRLQALTARAALITIMEEDYPCNAKTPIPPLESSVKKNR